MTKQEDFFIREIMPHQGTRHFYLGMPLSELYDILFNHFYRTGDHRVSGFFLYHTVHIKDSIEINIDVQRQYVYNINFKNNYAGKYEGVGIGSPVSELLKLRNDVFFDEQFILIPGNQPYDFIMRVDNEDRTIRSLDEVASCRITEIAVEDKTISKTQ